MTDAQPLSVCILEDHLIVREGLALLLESAGVRVLASTSSPGPFLEALAAHQPDVALLDLMLPEGGGLELVEQVRGRFPRLPLLVVSGSTEPGIAERCAQVGAAGFLEKASTMPRLLVDAIQAVARGEGFFPSRTLIVMPEPPLHPMADRLRQLTPREREVLAHIAAGEDNLKIAARLNITERTVRAHVSSLYHKLGTENRTQMALLAGQLGVRPPRPL